jgi:hypothetical protein
MKGQPEGANHRLGEVGQSRLGAQGRNAGETRSLGQSVRSGGPGESRKGDQGRSAPRICRGWGLLVHIERRTWGLADLGATE